MNTPITSTEIEAVIKNLAKQTNKQQQKKTKAQDQIALQQKSIKHLEKS